MKRNIIALISIVLSLSEFSVSTLSAATDYKEHRFRDGIYSTQTDRRAEKNAVAVSKENASVLVAETKSSNLYEQEAGAGIKMISSLDDILNSLEVGSQILVLNINNPWSRNCWGCGYWGYYDPFYYDRWYGPYYRPWDPFYRPWDPFYWDRWRWGYYHAGFWGPWGFGPDPWWPGYRPYPVYPVHPIPYYRRPAGTYASATRGGNHHLGGSGLNHRIATPAGGSAGASAIGGRRIAVPTNVSARKSAPARTATVRTTPTRIATGKTASAKVTAGRTLPARVTTGRALPARVVTNKTASARVTTSTATSSKTINTRLNSNVRASRTATATQGRGYSSTQNGNSSSYYRSSRSYSSPARSSGSYSRPATHSYGGGSRSFSGGATRSISSGGHGRR